MAYVLQMSTDQIKENGFTLKEDAEIIAEKIYGEVLTLRTIIPAQAESLLHCLGQTAGGICL